MQPVFIDSERLSWNLDPALVIETIERKVREGKRPKAVIPVHLYGQSADLDPILEVCARYDIPVIEAAETLGATYKGRSPGTFGLAGIFSFDGNKIITTSGGGMLVSADKALIEHARKLSTQARDPAPHYQHSEIGYNYRLSNVLAAIGRGQLRVLEQRAQRKREIFAFYRDALAGACPPGPQFWGRRIYFPQDWGVGGPPAGRTSRPVRSGSRPPTPRNRGGLALPPPRDGGWGGEALFPEGLCVAWGTGGALALPPPRIGGGGAEALFRDGLCLPSGTAMSDAELARVVEVVRPLHSTRPLTRPLTYPPPRATPSPSTNLPLPLHPHIQS